jgi:hypothetical protein
MHLDTVRFQRELLYRPTFWVIVVPQVVSLVLATSFGVLAAQLLRDCLRCSRRRWHRLSLRTFWQLGLSMGIQAGYYASNTFFRVGLY